MQNFYSEVFHSVQEVMQKCSKAAQMGGLVSSQAISLIQQKLSSGGTGKAGGSRDDAGGLADDGCALPGRVPGYNLQTENLGFGLFNKLLRQSPILNKYNIAQIAHLVNFVYCNFFIDLVRYT